MSSSKKAKAQTYDTGGLYGSARTGSGGTTYNATDFEKKLINLTNNYIPQYLEQMVNPTYDSEIFKAQTQQRNRLANQSFENNLINPLASRGLTRGSSINQMSNQFANKLADLEVDAMANSDTRNVNILNNLFDYYQMPYNMMTDISDRSKTMYENAKAEAQASGGTMGATIGKLAGAGLGAVIGGPAGAYMGSGIGATAGSLFDR